MSETPLPERIVYGVTADGSARLMRRSTAEHLAALLAARTFGDLRRDLPETAAQIEAESYTDLGEDAPDDDAPFDLSLLHGYEDGDAPVWPAQELLEWLPADLRERFVFEQESVLNGPFGEIDADGLEPLAAALAERGALVERDDALIERAEQY
jgi:hypothetical protein